MKIYKNICLLTRNKQKTRGKKKETKNDPVPDPTQTILLLLVNVISRFLFHVRLTCIFDGNNRFKSVAHCQLVFIV